MEIWESFFEKGIAFLKELWYNIMRLRVTSLSGVHHTEVYRSGHNGLDSKAACVYHSTFS